MKYITLYKIKTEDIILIETTKNYNYYVGERYKLNLDDLYTILGIVRDISYDGYMYITVDVISTNIPSDKLTFNKDYPATIAMNPKSAHYIPKENIKILETN